jgi:hypothetical protein
MRAKVTTAFNGWSEAEPEPRDFQVGEVLGERDPNLAYQAATTRVTPDSPDNTATFAEWIAPPTQAELDVRGDDRTQPKPLYTVQPVGTDRPAKGDHPELMARLDTMRAAAQDRQRLDDEAKERARAAAQAEQDRAAAIAPRASMQPPQQPSQDAVTMRDAPDAMDLKGKMKGKG